MRLLVDSLRTRCYGAMKEGRRYRGRVEDEAYTILGRRTKRENERKRATPSERENERIMQEKRREEKGERELIWEGAEWKGERFHTGYPLEGSGARDSHRRHARSVACRHKRRRSRITNSINSRGKAAPRLRLDWIEIARPARYFSRRVHNAKRQCRSLDLSLSLFSALRERDICIATCNSACKCRLLLSQEKKKEILL